MYNLLDFVIYLLPIRFTVLYTNNNNNDTKNYNRSINSSFFDYE